MAKLIVSNLISLDGFCAGPGSKLGAQLHLLIGSVMLGGGVRAFEHGLAAPLRLTALRRLPGSDTVFMQYSCGSRA